MIDPIPTAGTPARLDSLLADTSRTFALTIPLLPEPTRCEVTVAYLLFRVADTLEDATEWGASRKRAELARLGETLREDARSVEAERLAARWTAMPPCAHAGYRELLAALPEVLSALEQLGRPAQAAIRSHLGRTIDRMAGFVGQDRDRGPWLADLADLQRYCYAVAGIVGEMLTELFLIGRPMLDRVAPELRSGAPAFGEALQLVNILKDAAADASEGRSFLPPAVAREEVFGLARADLDAAGRYCRTLARAGGPRGLLEFTALPVLLARATLDRVERDGPGAKLSRLEVVAIATQLREALDRDRYDDLWTERRETR
jgi:farnesyl-diphosphate farnesyltransferase